MPPKAMLPVVHPYPELSAARRDIVEAGARMYRYRLVVGLEGNLSARLAEDRVLATPAGVCKGSLRPEELVVTDMEGRPLSGGRPSTELGMHLAIYRTRPDVRAIAHGHPPHATAFAVAGRDLHLCLMPEIVVSVGAVPVSRYATPSTAEVAAAVRELAVDHEAFLLRNHGAVALGTSVMDAYFRLETIEQLARITLLAEALGGAQPLSAEDVRRLNEIRGVYGLQQQAPACTTREDAQSPLARLIAEEIARALGDESSLQ